MSPAPPSYLCVISCPDCTGEDEQGCFDGGTLSEILPTREQAESWGDEKTKGSIWTYEIKEISV